MQYDFKARNFGQIFDRFLKMSALKVQRGKNKDFNIHKCKYCN